ncbi:MAG: tRNA uridine-5-carboxymethylaminomethyl(34) synthesis GTPase MnmE [Spirochaetaceae bacterium]
MNELPYDTEDPIAALATPWGESALAVLRTAGKGCIDLAASCFSKPEKLRQAAHGTMVYGYIIDAESGDRVDQVLAAVFRPPGGYTGQESVEISCHGSPPGIKRILDVLRKAGFRDAAAGEFTLRAFLNGKMDLTRAEAVAEIIGAKSMRAQSLALGRLSGNVCRRIDSLKGELAGVLAGVEVQLDYPEDELESAPEVDLGAVYRIKEGIEELAASYRTGRIYQEGAVAAITGPTNAGKSSLFNLFLKEDRSIVSEVHGTTRDYIESWISVQGVPVRLIDTAGLRDAEHPVELEGIRRSEQVVENASLVLYLVDATEGPGEEQLRLFREKERNEKFLFILNKVDLLETPQPQMPGWFLISAETGQGFSRLEEEMERRLLGTGSTFGGLYIDNRRQFDLLQRAAGALGNVIDGTESGVPLDFTASDLKDAVDSLGEITGEVTSADILARIFSDFCVGK